MGRQARADKTPNTDNFARANLRLNDAYAASRVLAHWGQPDGRPEPRAAAHDDTTQRTGATSIGLKSVTLPPKRQ